MILYVDGVEKSKAKSPVNQVPETADPLVIGALFTGSIDEFAMYNRALTEDEVKKDMTGISLVVASQGKLSVTWGNIKNKQ
ncbi:MAG: LamG protein [Candidatus Poribacteria bacterium]|nr:LamG protein [Candidatus Poribacteria bacterium]